MRNKLTLITALFVTALGLGAWRHGPGHGRGIEKMAEHLTADLNLSTDQIAKLDAVVASFKEARKQSREARKANREQLVSLVAAKDLDTVKLSSLLDSRHAEMEKARPQILAKITDFHKSLNEDQRKKLAQKLGDMGHHFSKGE